MNQALHDQAWGSHLAVLMSCLLATDGPVLEVGTGYWSTPILRAFCDAANRDLVSLESNPDWAALFGVTPRPYDQSLHEQAGIFSVALLDHSPGERRPDDALRLKNRAVYIVIHDYAAEIQEGFRPILDRWKYRWFFSQFRPHTLVLSNSREIPA